MARIGDKVKIVGVHPLTGAEGLVVRLTCDNRAWLVRYGKRYVGEQCSKGFELADNTVRVDDDNLKPIRKFSWE